MPDLGRAAVVTALVLLGYALVGGAYAAWRGRRRLADSARNALIGAFRASAVPTASSAPAVLRNRHAGRDVVAWVVPVLGLVGTFFAFLLVFVSSPFATQPAAADGAGLNPSLQNRYMAIHPPLLYLGYVGLTVPFAFAMGALLSKRTDERWIVATRRWTLTAWTFLGVGQLLGAHWAYVEVGWGG